MDWNSRIPAVFLYSELGIACAQIPGFSGVKIDNSIIIYSKNDTFAISRTGPDYKECSNIFG